MNARERLIVALDLPSVQAAESMVTKLGASVSFYKIGYQLAYAGGLPFAAGLIAAGKQVFLDLKLHDIGHRMRLPHLDIGLVFRRAVAGERGGKIGEFDHHIARAG